MPGESGRRAVTNATFVAVTGATLTATREVEVETPPICARLKLYWQNPSAPLAIDIDIVAAVASLIASGLVQAARALPRLRSENAPAKISFLNICVLSIGGTWNCKLVRSLRSWSSRHQYYYQIGHR